MQISGSMRALTVAFAFLLGASASRAGLETEWRTFVEPELGTRVDIPAGIFSVNEGPATKGTGQMFKSDDGRAVLAIYSLRNRDERETPAQYLKMNFNVPRASVDYERVTGRFFAISAVHAGEIYYSRCNFSHNFGGAIHCFDLRYPEREKHAWDSIVTRISRSLR